MGGTENLTSFALLTAVISPAQFLYFIESHENTIVEFLFCYLNKTRMQNIYLWYSPIHVSKSHSSTKNIPQKGKVERKCLLAVGLFTVSGFWRDAHTGLDTLWENGHDLDFCRQTWRLERLSDALGSQWPDSGAAQTSHTQQLSPPHTWNMLFHERCLLHACI